jgi:hypothetical protein
MINYDSIIVTLILGCSIYECYILRKEYEYDENKDLEKKLKRTKTTKKVTQSKDGTHTTEETSEITEPKEEKCLHRNTWFDRTIEVDPSGKESGMKTRCTDCGISLD